MNHWILFDGGGRSRLVCADKNESNPKQMLKRKWKKWLCYPASQAVVDLCLEVSLGDNNSI